MNLMISWTESEMEKKDCCKGRYCRLLNLKRFVCKKTPFAVNVLFDKKPV